MASQAVKAFLFTEICADDRVGRPASAAATEMNSFGSDRSSGNNLRRKPMTVLPDQWIREMATRHRMIEPYADLRRRKGKISYGASSYGYDFRLSDEYKIPDFTGAPKLDPKTIEEIRFRDYRGRDCWVPPNSYILGRSLEYFRIPRDVIVTCQGKSTYARSGLFLNVTPLEPEWEGFITLALVNAAPVAVRVYSGEGIGQIIFFRAERECKVSYADRKGKYHAQRQIRLSQV